MTKSVTKGIVEIKYKPERFNLKALEDLDINFFIPLYLKLLKIHHNLTFYEK